ncbi:sensor domain-containing protein [Paenibacillus aestuarii]|uniref:EAL domain-containing protein n=1 Tax=Paenibacillus aestuarii TaxID=516965 RepID=A0ABW0KIG1_9BACL|nr:bifunctional diguanylate cyclase/phosphodiesterase [Paenibacillus aestuarii]
MTSFFSTERMNKLEQDLHYAQEIVEALTGHSAVAFVVCDLNHRVQYSNERFHKTFGWNAPELFGQSLPTIPVEVRQSFQELLHVNHWEFQTTGARRLCKDESTLTVQESVMPLRDLEGTVTAYAYVVSDITDNSNDVERKLMESRQRLQSLFDNNPDAVISLDMSGKLTGMNPATYRLSGYTLEELGRLPVEQLFAPQDLHQFRQGFERTMSGRPQNFETMISSKNGAKLALHVTLVPISYDGTINGVYGIAKNITERKQAEDLIQYMAYYDALTDLPNRRLFERKVMLHLNEADEGQTKIAILYLDLDGFKFINDSLGHSFGDLVLKEVAARLKSSTREIDTVGRMGGDEFTICIPHVRTTEDVQPIAERILHELRQPFQLQGQDFYLSASIGVALYPDHGSQAEMLMHHADTALYKVKEYGKNHVKIYSQSMNEEAIRRQQLESELHKALKRDEFILHYQPQIDVQTDKIIGLEALVRWDHPFRGLMYPGDFITIAEETGLIVPIGKKVLEMACRQCKTWHDQGFTNLRVAVNLSQIQLRQDDFVDTVDRILRAAGLPPTALELEITESIAMHNTEFVLKQLHNLVALGVQISIDDFGTGFSSLSYLSKFPIHRLKIDRSFITNIANRSESAIITSIVGLAHNLNLSVIVEGVETQLQREVLPKLGCTEMQGYLFSKPVPPEVCIPLLKKSTI